MVDVERFRSLVTAIPDAEYSRYPNLSRRGVDKAVEAFLSAV
jgi:hypothetical protein